MWFGVPNRGPRGDFSCNLGPAQLGAAITAQQLITLPHMRSVYRGSRSRQQRSDRGPALNSPLVIALQASKRHKWGQAGGTGEGMTLGALEAHSPSHGPSQEVLEGEGLSWALLPDSKEPSPDRKWVCVGWDLGMSDLGWNMKSAKSRGGFAGP